ncbi:MAG: RluA family pseudouridine synthase [Ruminococcaceae bacterium]|nr:RluA family pseudouridine synthase [Oscillospiraceae bacterium]
MEQILLKVEENNIRIDKFLANKLENMTRSRVQKLIDEECVKISGEVIKANYKVKSGEEIEVNIPDVQSMETVAEDIPLDIVFEDDCMLVVNKPQGMVVHPAAGNYSGTLVNALLHYCPDTLSGINGEKRPGILHRIDKDTSGLLLVAKNDLAHQSLSEQIKAHSLTREYRALVHGNIKNDEGTINAPIGRHPVDRKKMTITNKNSREAITHYKVLERFKGYTFISCRLETGRTHQIRVHMSSGGHSIVGDKTYGIKDKFNLNGQLLHACRVGFIHPVSGEYMEFMRDIPVHFENVIERLRREL